MKTFGANLMTRAQLALSIPASDIQCLLDVAKHLPVEITLVFM